MTANKPEMAIPVSLVFVGSPLSTYATSRYATACEGSSLSSRAQRNYMFLKQIGDPTLHHIPDHIRQNNRARGSMVERKTQIPKVAGSNPRSATPGIGYDWLMKANKPEMAIPVSLVFVGSPLSTYATSRYATACFPLINICYKSLCDRLRGL
ncbi:unnamed protein product [Schistocephalus solidus]|uniref:Secreted protein n=1 Tax=Schistocephalus solidus TaxID=70667 RepID=A0A183TDA4_SCHSO|nr:unnamed protein product [Schistocephalus solidus]